MSTPQPTDHKWASVFIEIALRAIRRVHYEYGHWGVGPQFDMNRDKARKLNMGPGVELADEVSVCAAISQEFLSSPSLTGLWTEQGGSGTQQKELRFFAVDREKFYTGTTEEVDLFVQKYEIRDPKLDPVPIDNPSFVEAKRAQLWKPNISDGTAKPYGSQYGAIRKDIAKLRSELAVRSNAGHPPIYCHVLVWGICSDPQSDDHPVKFFEKFDQDVVLQQVRWLPIEWTSPGIDDLKPDMPLPEVAKALWVALAEVFSPSSN